MTTFFTIISNDIKLATKRGSGVLNLLAFFVIAAALFPFGIGSESDVLQQVGVGVIWVCALLASMLAIPSIFDDDFSDGTLASIYLQGILPEVIVLCRLFSGWLINCLPLILVSPLLAMLFHIEEKTVPLMLTLLIGTPALYIIGAVGAALTLGLKRGGGLLGIIVLPLYIPILIFGVAAVDNLQNVLFLLGILLLLLPVGVVAAAAAVRLALEE